MRENRAKKSRSCKFFVFDHFNRTLRSSMRVKRNVPCGIKLSELLSRIKADTLQPRARRLAMRARPRKPVLPVTRIRSSIFGL